MKNTRSYPSGSLQEQKAITLINAKYTYKDICGFHNTVLNILDYCNLSGLTQSELGNISHFTHIILKLLDSSKISQVVINDSQLDFDTPKTQPKNINDKTKPDKSLHYLLIWIAQILRKRKLTLEIILDHYYAHFPFLKDPLPAKGHFQITTNYLTP